MREFIATKVAELLGIVSFGTDLCSARFSNLNAAEAYILFLDTLGMDSQRIVRNGFYEVIAQYTP